MKSTTYKKVGVKDGCSNRIRFREFMKQELLHDNLWELYEVEEFDGPIFHPLFNTVEVPKFNKEFVVDFTGITSRDLELNNSLQYLLYSTNKWKLEARPDTEVYNAICMGLYKDFLKRMSSFVGAFNGKNIKAVKRVFHKALNWRPKE